MCRRVPGRCEVDSNLYMDEKLAGTEGIFCAAVLVGSQNQAFNLLRSKNLEFGV